ncbi:hypothetical protein JTB14_032069 [Gonioctena quinquepunctata]|nr:hypothetical protein JTB14_032069 [Gonioctena quinquepunctata]
MFNGLSGLTGSTTLRLLEKCFGIILFCLSCFLNLFEAVIHPILHPLAVAFQILLVPVYLLFLVLTIPLRLTFVGIKFFIFFVAVLLPVFAYEFLFGRYLIRLRRLSFGD